jgi:hypothetical protein
LTRAESCVECEGALLQHRVADRLTAAHADAIPLCAQSAQSHSCPQSLTKLESSSYPWSKKLGAGQALVRKTLRQARELDDADKAERLLRNLAHRLGEDAHGVAASMLEGLDEMLTVNRLGLPIQLRCSLACTNSIENMTGTARRVCRNVKRWQNVDMALRWTAAGMMEAAKSFRRLKAHKQLPILTAALAAHQAKHANKPNLEKAGKPHSIIDRQRSAGQVQQRAGQSSRAGNSERRVRISLRPVYRFI